MLKKRAMSILIVALLATACGGSSEPADTAASDTEPAETVESTEAEPVEMEGLADKRPDKAPIIAIVTDGGRTMPDFAEKLSEAEIVAVVDFVHTAWPAPAES